MSNHVLTELARLESELQRIQRELDVLRKSVGAPPSTRRTQSFAPVMSQRSEKDADTREMPASTPPPQPSIAVKSETVPTSRNSATRTEASKSERRVQTGARTGITEFPAATPTPLPPAKRSSSPAPDAGRYEFVGEGKSARRR